MTFGSGHTHAKAGWLGWAHSNWEHEKGLSSEASRLFCNGSNERYNWEQPQSSASRARARALAGELMGRLGKGNLGALCPWGAHCRAGEGAGVQREGGRAAAHPQHLVVGCQGLGLLAARLCNIIWPRDCCSFHKVSKPSSRSKFTHPPLRQLHTHH